MLLAGVCCFSFKTAGFLSDRRFEDLQNEGWRISLKDKTAEKEVGIDAFTDLTGPQRKENRRMQ